MTLAFPWSPPVPDLSTRLLILRWCIRLSVLLIDLLIRCIFFMHPSIILPNQRSCLSSCFKYSLTARGGTARRMRCPQLRCFLPLWWIIPRNWRISPSKRRSERWTGAGPLQQCNKASPSTITRLISPSKWLASIRDPLSRAMLAILNNMLFIFPINPGRRNVSISLCFYAIL